MPDLDLEIAATALAGLHTPSPHFPPTPPQRTEESMRWIGAALGLVLLLLGGLWLLQGTGLVTLPPLFCVADCAPVEAPSLQWTLIGAIALAGGAAAIWLSLHRRK